MKALAKVALLATAFVAAPIFAHGAHKHGTELTGTWQIVATIPAGAPVCPGPDDCVYPALATATSDGTLLQTAPISNTLTGHGAWKRAGPRAYRGHTIYFRVDAASGAFVGTSETTIDVTVAPGGETAEGTFHAVIFDAVGTKLAEYSGTITAERVEAE